MSLLIDEGVSGGNVALICSRNQREVCMTTVLGRQNTWSEGPTQTCESRPGLPNCHSDLLAFNIRQSLSQAARRVIICIWCLGSDGKLVIHPGRLSRENRSAAWNSWVLAEFSRTPLFQEKARPKQLVKAELLLLVSKNVQMQRGLTSVAKEVMFLFFLQEQMFIGLSCARSHDKSILLCFTPRAQVSENYERVCFGGWAWALEVTYRRWFLKKSPHPIPLLFAWLKPS